MTTAHQPTADRPRRPRVCVIGGGPVRVAMIGQAPRDACDPRWTLRRTIGEPFRIAAGGRLGREAFGEREAVDAAAESVLAASPDLRHAPVDVFVADVVPANPVPAGPTAANPVPAGPTAAGAADPTPVGGI